MVVERLALSDSLCQFLRNEVGAFYEFPAKGISHHLIAFAAARHGAMSTILVRNTITFHRSWLFRKNVIRLLRLPLPSYAVSQKAARFLGGSFMMPPMMMDNC
jgi:hypothetical protein